MEIIVLATTLALAVLGIALMLTVVRVILGPTLPDRVLALDLASILTAAILSVFALRTGNLLYVEIAVVLLLVALLSTAAFARYILLAGKS